MPDLRHIPSSGQIAHGRDQVPFYSEIDRSLAEHEERTSSEHGTCVTGHRRSYAFGEKCFILDPCLRAF